ncbi:MAG: DUF2203 domain-containing protein [Bryobacteraceae bacterium]
MGRAAGLWQFRFPASDRLAARMPRYFTLSEAEDSLRRIESLLRQAVSAGADLRELKRDLQESLQRIAMLGGSRVNQGEIARRRSSIDAAETRLRETAERIQETGCLVKDLDIGLIDFPAIFRGREVYLCWKLGEPKILFWHPVEEGFRGRKPIDEEFIREQSDAGSN